MSECNYKEFWQFAMEQIHEEYKNNNQETEFKLWFNVEYVKDDINTITVSVASDFLWQAMVKKGNIKKISEKIQQLTGQEKIELKPIVKNSLISKQNKKAEVYETVNVNPKEKITEVKTNYQKNEKSEKNTILNENYTFDTFVSGEGSDFAYKASLAVSSNPGKEYNPILFYGGVGLGKTHLMQAIGNEIYKKYGSTMKICYIQAESFANEFFNAISSKTTNKFKNKYRNLDVLLLDDIHFLQDKEATQEELFYTFNALRGINSQMVFTCDRPITELKTMLDRLRNRFSNGLCIDINPPNYETRLAILHKKLENSQKKLPNDVLDYIAKNVETNIRDLESALTKILGYSEFINTKITLEIAQHQLKDFFVNSTIKNINIDTIQKVIADNYQISISDIKGKKRDKKFVIPRHIALYISRELTEYSFSELGNEFGGRDHSSIMHATDKISKQIETDPSFASKVQLLIKEIKEYKK